MKIKGLLSNFVVFLLFTFFIFEFKIGGIYLHNNLNITDYAMNYLVLMLLLPIFMSIYASIIQRIIELYRLKTKKGSTLLIYNISIVFMVASPLVSSMLLLIGGSLFMIAYFKMLYEEYELQKEKLIKKIEEFNKNE